MDEKKNSTSLFSGLQHATKNTSEKNSPPSAASVADYSLNAVSHYIMLFWSSLALSF